MSDLDDSAAEARALLAAAGLQPPDDEVVMLVAMYPLLRAGVEALYALDVGYES
jgi:hypothetical protein